MVFVTRYWTLAATFGERSIETDHARWRIDSSSLFADARGQRKELVLRAVLPQWNSAPSWSLRRATWSEKRGWKTVVLKVPGGKAGPGS